LLNELYAIRSTLVHGSPLSADQMSVLRDRDRWWKFEEVVRELLVTALKKVPPDEALRRSYLASLYDLDDEARAGRIDDEFSGIKDTNVKQKLLRTLQGYPQ
jgi:hypothetical protein